MKFLDTEPDYENGMLCRCVSENGLVELAVHPVLFGFRIRAGFIGDGFVHLDYCFAQDVLYLIGGYITIKTILSQREENRKCFLGFPRQEVKPMSNSPECYLALTRMIDFTNGYHLAECKNITPVLLIEQKHKFISGLFKTNDPGK